VTIPRQTKSDSDHVKFKHIMYSNLVHKMNGTDLNTSVLKSKSNIENINKGKIAGAVDLNNGFISYYFSSGTTIKAQT
jgi:hypothetical protein